MIGLSYYPFWHGYLNSEQVKDKTDKNNLVNAINNLKTLFPDKKVQKMRKKLKSLGVIYD